MFKWVVMLAFFGVALGQPAGEAETEMGFKGPSPDSVSSQVPSDSATVVPSDPQTLSKSPGRAVLFSALIPGGGQVYTGHWWKAALIGPAEVALGYFSVKDHIGATEALRSGQEAEYVRLRNRRNAFLWWTGAVLALSMADAYVSAQMYGFDRQMRFSGRTPRLALAVGPMRVGIVTGL